MEVDPEAQPSAALLASIEQLIVHEEGGGGFQFDSLEFIPPGDFNVSEIFASAIGTMVNDASVELVVWTRGDVVTRLELEPFGETRLPIRMPLLQSIRPYPAVVFEEEPDTDEP
ncbi:MAG: hypothetical protein ACREU2_17920 [Steroidobacteraceae bacterium]